MNKIFTIEIPAEWENIEKAANEASVFLEQFDLTAESQVALFMVINELLENAIKYGYFNSGKDKVKLSIQFNEKEILIDVSNPVSPDSDEHLERLDDHIQWIRGYQNPFQAFVEKVKQISTRSMQDEESGLGLVRIAYEGHSIVDFYVNEDDILLVSVVFPLS